MISRGPLAYNAEETCRLLFTIILDAIGNFGNGSDSQIIGSVENLGYCTLGSHPYTGPSFIDPSIEFSKLCMWVDKQVNKLVSRRNLPAR